MQELKRHQDQRGKVDANEVLEVNFAIGLRPRYAMSHTYKSGTGQPGSMGGPFQADRARVQGAISLRESYAISGADIVYDARTVG